MSVGLWEPARSTSGGRRRACSQGLSSRAKPRDLPVKRSSRDAEGGWGNGWPMTAHAPGVLGWSEGSLGFARDDSMGEQARFGCRQAARLFRGQWRLSIWQPVYPGLPGLGTCAVSDWVSHGWARMKHGWALFQSVFHPCPSAAPSYENRSGFRSAGSYATSFHGRICSAEHPGTQSHGGDCMAECPAAQSPLSDWLAGRPGMRREGGSCIAGHPGAQWEGGDCIAGHPGTRWEGGDCVAGCPGTQSEGGDCVNRSFYTPLARGKSEFVDI